MCLNHYNYLLICGQNFLREEVKENLKWNVDRSSPSNKIRDLMGWTRDIMQDISYQRKILCNPIAMMFTKGWYVLLLILKLHRLFSWNQYVCYLDVFQAKRDQLNFLSLFLHYHLGCCGTMELLFWVSLSTFLCWWRGTRKLLVKTLTNTTTR